MPDDLEKPEQLIFDLPHRQAFGREDFLVSACNEAAVKVIDVWPKWPNPVLLIVGPPGSGKSHLAHVWRMLSDAHMIPAREINYEDVSTLGAKNAVIIENVDDGKLDEKALFHLLNLSKEQQFHMLITARSMPGEWTLKLPDLRSRLRSLPVVNIGAPDELLLKTILIKLFNDRQLIVAPHVIDYIAVRMERSMEAAQTLVEALDKRALATGRKVTRPLVAEVLPHVAKHEGE